MTGGWSAQTARSASGRSRASTTKQKWVPIGGNVKWNRTRPAACSDMFHMYFTIWMSGLTDSASDLPTGRAPRQIPNAPSARLAPGPAYSTRASSGFPE